MAVLQQLLLEDLLGLQERVLLLRQLLLEIFSNHVHSLVHALLSLFVLPLFLQKLATHIFNGYSLLQNLLVQLPQLLLNIKIGLLPRRHRPTGPRPLQLPPIGQISHLPQAILLELHHLLRKGIDLAGGHRQLALVTGPQSGILVVLHRQLGLLRLQRSPEVRDLRKKKIDLCCMGGLQSCGLFLGQSVVFLSDGLELPLSRVLHLAQLPLQCVYRPPVCCGLRLIRALYLGVVLDQTLNFRVFGNQQLGQAIVLCI